MRSIKSILWSYGISGDLPIVLIVIKTYEDTNIIYEVLKAHEYWKNKGILCDLVIISEDGVSYTHPLWNNIYEIISNSYIRNMQNIPGGIYLLRGENLLNEEQAALKKAAAIVISEGEFSGNIIKKNELNLKDFSKTKKSYNTSLPDVELEFFNGIGGFDEKNNEYVINLSKDALTPLPWVNILANKTFGTCVTESGGGNTWYMNSREFRLTPWNNDVVSDKRGEIIYIRDDETGEIFNPYILPSNFDGKYRVRYGLGYAVYEASVCGLKLTLTVFVPQNDNLKISLLDIENKVDEERKLTVFYVIEPSLLYSPDGKERFIDANAYDSRITFLNKYEDVFNEKEVMMSLVDKDVNICLDKNTFFGMGNEKSPDFLKLEMDSNFLNYELPIGVISKKVSLGVKECYNVPLLFGENNRKIVDKYVNNAVCLEELKRVKNFYNNEIMKIRVKTENKAFDLLVNGFLVYQTLVCRLWARSAFYQSGGAFGYRDQLQDSLSLLYIDSSITKKQILKHASRQFEEGDVLHWWHEEKKCGTRTRFSDDLLWLPYAVLTYILVTGDKSILSEEIGFIKGELLRENEDERYIVFCDSDKKASLYEHCKLSIDYAYKLGEHGLVLMGAGDWNDGMNTVGNKGKGESIWLSWFMYKILTGFASILRDKNEVELAGDYSEKASKLAQNLNNFAWDGSWYKRAIFDDGTPLGSIENTECKIDSISQSWSAISDGGDKEKVKRALNSAKDYLVDKENKIIKLLTPAFHNGDLKPGYIKNYPEGIRENGGQYTHGAIWLGIAYAIIKDNESAYEIFDILNPINHSRTDVEMKKYQVEPYVMSADIYTNEKHFGRGGWSWYTGASGWMYRFAIEYILGIKKCGNAVLLEPVIPKTWREFEVEYKYNKTVYKIHVVNKIDADANKLTVDGTLKEGNMFLLSDDNDIHFVEYIGKL